MKLSFREIEPFVKKPDPAARVILVYGPDAGLVCERAETMGKTVVSDLNDPFNVATLSGDILADDPARLSDEAGAISMMGGDRLVRVMGAGDKVANLVKDYLENPSDSAVVIIESGDLGPRSSLRKLCETSPAAAAVPCYIEDERDIGRLIVNMMQQEQITISSDAIQALASNIVGDRQKARREIEKLLIYKGKDTSPISYEDVQAAIGDAGAITLDELVYAVAGGQAGTALAAYNKLVHEDVSFIVILRSVQNHFRKLHLACGYMESGLSVDQAAGKLKPPLFFKVAPQFKAQMQRWNLRTLSTALSRLSELEAQCKTTGAPVTTLCGQALLSISSIGTSDRKTSAIR